MKISLIIPLYNEEDYLRRCLDSVKDQTESFDEVIIIDDGSTDKSLSIAKEYDFKIYSYENGGLSVARNRGLEKATGDYIVFLDADDSLLPNACRLMKMMIKQYPNENIMQFNHLRYYTKLKKSVRKYDNRAGIFTIENLPKCKCWWSAWNKVYKRKSITHKFRDEMRYGEDGVFNLDNILEGLRIRCIDENVLIHYFENPNSLTKIKTKEQIELLEQIQRDILYHHCSPEEKWCVIKSLVDIIDAELHNPTYIKIKEGNR